MSVPRFTTPTFTFTFQEPNLNLTEATNVYVTFRSRGYTVTKMGDDLTVGEKEISVFLSQKDTSKFDVDDVEIQANWTMPGGRRAASEKILYPISEQLLQRVIE